MTSTNPVITIYQKEFSGHTILDFRDILLDETLISGTIHVPECCFSSVSTLNQHLPGKQVYELTLRLAEHFPVVLTNKLPQDTDSCFSLSVKEEASELHGLQTDCYIAARYKNYLLQNQLFDAAISSILAQTEALGLLDEILPFLEKMLAGDSLYQYYLQGSQPFLIYTGDDTCYSILSVFANELGNALRRQHYLVEYFDLSKENFTDSYRLMNRQFQAIIGVQTYMFSVRLNNGCLLHDSIGGPKYNFVLDHPVWFHDHLQETPKDYTIFTLDHNYVSFAKQYYHIDARFFPPGGITTSNSLSERSYAVTFIGTYLDNSSDVFHALQELDRPQRFLVNRLWLIMRKQPHLPAETALSMALAHYGKELPSDEFLQLLRELRTFILFISYRYRTKLLESLLAAGISIHIWGTSWEFCPLRRYSGFIWHNENLSTEQCLQIWQKSRIALNAMSWHKNAITERILNSMLQGAAVATERNPYMESRFLDGADIIYYDLAHLEELPRRISALLKEPDILSSIAKNGFQKALTDHTWNARAKELLEIAKHTI